MWLDKISILNYKNLSSVELSFSPKINCILGKNGMGKTNLIDAVYFLSFCKSATNAVDSQNILHNADFFMLHGTYKAGIDEDRVEEISCALKRRQKKVFKRNKKEYTRLAEHIGLIPVVIVSPNDLSLIAGGSEERRRFIDLVLSQYDKEYLEALISYNKAMQQRNAMLKAEAEPQEEVLLLWEEIMAQKGQMIFQKRRSFIEKFIPIFQHYYTAIAGEEEQVSLKYESHLMAGELSALLRESYAKDRIMGYSLKGVHKDDLQMELEGFPIKREGSQGQNKTFLTALKLAQFTFLKDLGTTPIVLLDDIFDKLDSHRVTRILSLVSNADFGQIFITDTNRTNLDKILADVQPHDYKIFEVEQGNIVELSVE